MAKVYVTGPALIYFGAGLGNTPIFLGTAERYPKITIKPGFKPVYNDLGGEVPFDMAYQGEEAFVSADINRFNESGYTRMAARGHVNKQLLPIKGTDFAGDIGTLMVGENQAYNLWVVFPYAAKAVFNDMPKGYRFLSAYLIGPDELEPLGTTPRKLRLTWHCMRTFDPKKGNFYLYDHNIASLPAID